MRRFFLLIIGICCFWNLRAQQAERMDLSGLWRFQLDPMGFGKMPGSELYLSKLAETIVLPGSTDQGGKGIFNRVSYIDRLSRKFEYCGQAWYQREVVIPPEWAGREILLLLERCHWETTVYVDGEWVASEERLSTPDRFVLTRQMTPGIHTLTVCVDNRLKYPMDQWDHGTTEYTQTNWNGIVGRIELQAKIPDYIQRLKLFPDIAGRKVRVELQLHDACQEHEGKLSLILRREGAGEICRADFPVSSSQAIERELEIGREMELWDEFSPVLYEMEAVLDTKDGKDSRKVTFGMRQVEQGEHHIRLNGRDIHLRGTLNCCEFPLTGYPATGQKAWDRIFRTVKEYGLNHVRFHSWCPPEAAFDAADATGVYLQVELPMWIKDVGQYPARREFFEKELYAILDEYGNHPSFMLMCNGNENEGDFDVLENLVMKARKYDNRHLYSASTARTHVKADQFYTSHVTAKGGITVYEGKPSTDWDLTESSSIDVPVIAHEAGQRCMYPDFKEISKYTGVLEARNFHVFQERLTRNGMLSQAEDFFRATGAHTVLQYKEVNEALLRTATKGGGFQLLGLADFPGQGSAFIGILNAFWESKGLITPEKYRESCAPTVLLARFPKRVYSVEEHFSACLGIYHFGPGDLHRGTLKWWLEREDGTVYRQGKLAFPLIRKSTVDSIGSIDIPLGEVIRPGRYVLKTVIDNGADLRNEWNIWVYPEREGPVVENYILTGSWAEARTLLAQGEKVLLVPGNCPGRKTKFTGHFWNPIMFKWNPMIVGTLIDSHHPVFRDFPTSCYADWQWWDILNHSTAIDLTEFRQLIPVIQSVDTYEINRKLGIAFEANVGKGKLFVLCVDICHGMDSRPATRQLLISVRNYVNSAEFQPQMTLDSYDLDRLFDPRNREQNQNKQSRATELLLNR